MTANIFNYYWTLSDESTDIKPPGVQIKSYRVCIAHPTPWLQIECDLVNGSKVILKFLVEKNYDQFKEEYNNFPQCFVSEKDYGLMYMVYFPYSSFDHIWDLLRNEKPLFFVIVTNDGMMSFQPKTAFILTNPEPVGAEESLELSIPGLILYSKGNLTFDATTLVAEHLKNAGIIERETTEIISQLSALSRMNIKPDELAKVLERTTKDHNFRAEFRKNPKKAVRKSKPSR